MSPYLNVIGDWISLYAIRLIGALLIFVIGRWLAAKLSALIAKMLEKNKVDVTLVGFFENISYYALLVLVLIAVAGKLGINTTSFLTVIGAAGLAVGLALKDSLSNFASGVMLILFRPFRVGDYVTAGGESGTVEKISMFTTILKTPDNQQVIVPNGAITGNVITNVTANDTRRIELVIGIGYDDNIPKAKKILRDLVAEDRRILEDPAPVIAVKELGDSSVNLVVRPWVATGEYWNVYFDLIEVIKLSFDRNGITIPYPQQDVHLYKAAAAAGA